MSTELCIVIPAKNEEKLIPNLLRSIACQSYSRIKETPIILADAGSSDNTVSVAVETARKYGLSGFQIIAGGLPAVGRNAGAGRVESRYVLFIDADVQKVACGTTFSTQELISVSEHPNGSVSLSPRACLCSGIGGFSGS